MGVMVKRSADHQMFSDITAEVDRLVRISESTHADRENLVLDFDHGHRVEESRPSYGKLTTAKLAEKLGMQSSRLFQKLIGRGYLEIREGDKRYLTPAGKTAGGEFRMGKGPYFLWPPDLGI
jgi:hypothetical protein